MNPFDLKKGRGDPLSQRRSLSRIEDILSEATTWRSCTIDCINYPVGFSGADGEGHERRGALRAKRGVKLDHFIETAQRRTFTYCKPLVMHPGKPPLELNRPDSKNWTPTPATVQGRLADAIQKLIPHVDAFILLEQVQVPETGVLTKKVLETVETLITTRPGLWIIADSRRGLRGYPPVIFKMNAAELAAWTGARRKPNLEEIKTTAARLARRQGRPVFITLSERGILGASPEGAVEYVPCLPVRGPIDIVGAGDAVTANLIAALAAGATLRESLELANAAASIVIHVLGTTGTASVPEIRALLIGAGS